MRDYIDAAAFKEMILCADAALAANTQMINDLNVFPVPDGDTGTNMGLTMNKAAAELRKKDFETIAAAYGIPSLVANDEEKLDEVLDQFLNTKGCCLLICEVHPDVGTND